MAYVALLTGEAAESGEVPREELSHTWAAARKMTYVRAQSKYVRTTFSSFHEKPSELSLQPQLIAYSAQTIFCCDMTVANLRTQYVRVEMHRTLCKYVRIEMLPKNTRKYVRSACSPKTRASTYAAQTNRHFTAPRY